MPTYDELREQSDELEIRLAKVNRLLKNARGSERKILLEEKKQLMEGINQIIDLMLQ